MNLSQYRALLRVTVEKRFNLFRRYLFDSVFGIVSLFITFALALFGGQQIAPTVIDGSKSGLVVGFFVWTMAAAAYNDISQQVETEAEWGTLEQITMSPFGIGTVVFLNSIVYVVGGVLSGILMLVLMIMIADVSLSVPLDIVPIGALAIFSGDRSRVVTGWANADLQACTGNKRDNSAWLCWFYRTPVRRTPTDGCRSVDTRNTAVGDDDASRNDHCRSAVNACGTRREIAWVPRCRVRCVLSPPA